MLLLFLFSPVSFEGDYEVAENLLNDTKTLDYDYSLQPEQYDYLLQSEPQIKYPMATAKQRLYLTNAQRLYEDLMSGYEKDLSPAYSKYDDSSSPVLPPMNVSVVVGSVILLGVDDTAQIIHATLIFDLIWMDERLSWNLSKYADVRTLDVRREEVWMPDVSPYSCQSVVEDVPKAMRSVHVTHEGLLKYRMQLEMKCLCTLELEEYPFDRQKCGVQFFVSQHDPRNLLLIGSVTPYAGSLVGSDTWTVLDVTAKNEILEERMNFSLAVFTIHMERNFNYFIVFTILPTTILTAVCVLAMFHEAIDEYNRLEKIAIGVAALTGITLLLNIVADEVPRKKTTAVIAQFIIANLCVLTTAIIVVLVNPIGIVYSLLIRCRRSTAKISPATLVTDVPPQKKKSGASIDKSRFINYFFVCLRNEKIVLIVFEAVVFLFFGLIASFWSSEA